MDRIWEYRALRGAGLAVLLVAGCSEVGPVFPTSDQLEPWVRGAQTQDARSDMPPVIAGERVVFRLGRGQRRSVLLSGRGWRIRQSWLIGFDMRMAREDLPQRPVAVTRVAQSGVREVGLALVTADARHGVRAMGRACIAPEEVEAWHAVELRFTLAADRTGFLEVFCDRRPVWARSGVRMVRHTADGAEARFSWELGLIAARGVARDVTVEMRRVFQHRLFVIPNRVGRL